MTPFERQPAAPADNAIQTIWRGPPFTQTPARPDRAPSTHRHCPLMQAEAQRVIARTRTAWAAQQMLWC